MRNCTSGLVSRAKWAEQEAELAELRREIARLKQESADAFEQQTATSAILRAMANSPTDLQSVLNAVGESATRLCDASGGAIWRIEADHLRGVAWYGSLSTGPVGTDLPMTRGLAGARAIIDRQTIHIHDLAAESESEYPESLAFQKRFGNRTLLAAPLLMEDRPLGAIVLVRMQVRPFSDRQIALLETFADQAAIAIENVRLFQELQDKTRRLEEASRHKSEFLASMSHELRTPLNAIIGFTELLIEQLFGELNEKQLEYQRDILSSGQHLLSLINDILDLSKVEAGRMELEISQFSLREALGNGLSMLRERAGRREITLGLEVDPDLDLVEADERKVKQILFNLLSNAVKFTLEGGSVNVSAREIDGEVVIAVRDTGIGIAPEDLPHVFDECRQVGHGKARHEGTGLGLALAKKFAELHGGRIWVESEPGRGSTFTLALPARQAAPTDGSRGGQAAARRA